MAKVYVFENTDATEAAAFTNADYLTFANTSVNAQNIGVALNAMSGLSAGNITLTVGGVSLAFPTDALSAASIAGNVQFDNGSSLILGTAAANTALNGTTGDDVIYGFSGADSLSGAAGNDYLYGGTNDDVGGVAANDTLDGGAGNDHLYGNALTTVQGQADGADSIFGGTGADYLQGNAGNDTLDGGIGSDRIFGGSGDDSIVGGADTDTINGNTGNDIIDGGTSNDIIRGGQGNDLITGGADVSTTVAGVTTVTGGGNDILFGDLGNDTLTGGTGFDVLTGGDGNDVFSFAAGDASSSNITAGGNNTVDIILDYVDGSDKIDLTNTVATILTDSTTAPTTFGSLQSALTFAQGLMDGPNNTDVADNNTEVVALAYSGSTYLFAATAGGAIDTVINVGTATVASFGVSDFI